MGEKDGLDIEELSKKLGEAYYIRGCEHSEKGDYDQAIAGFSEAIRLNPKYATAYNRRGVAYFNKGDCGKAIEDLTEATQLNPDDDMAREDLRLAKLNKRIAECAEATGSDPTENNIDRVIAAYTEEIREKIQQEDDDGSILADMYIKRGVAYKENGDYDQAIADFTKAIEVCDEEDLLVEAYLNRWRAYAEKGDYIKANEDYAEAYFTRGGLDRTEDDYKDMYIERGVVYKENGDYDQAIADFTKVIEVCDYEDLLLAEAYLNRGRTYAEKGDSVKADEDYAEAYFARGGLAKDDDKAIADFSEAIRLAPNYTKAYNNRGVAYYNKGDYDKAIEDFTVAIRLNSDDDIARKNLRFAELKKRIAECTEAIRLDPTDAEAYVNRGDAYSCQGEYDKASNDYSKALRIEPNYAEAEKALAKAYVNLAKAYVNRGQANFCSKEYNAAFENYSEALRINPDCAEAERCLTELADLLEDGAAPLDEYGWRYKDGDDDEEDDDDL